MTLERNKQCGVTLIESMIAILILAFAMISMVKLQMSSLRASSDSRYDLIAASRAQEIMEHISYLNLTDAQWNAADSASVPAGNTVLGPWLTGMATALPEGRGTVSCAARICAVTIEWTPPGSPELRTAQFEVRN
jgi:type IV pilus assembly protein PilV